MNDEIIVECGDGPSKIVERDLTKKEVDFINYNHKCPLCFIGLFLCGPQGGCGMNIRCDNCGKEFGVGFTGDAWRPIWRGDIIFRDDRSVYGGLLDWGCPAPVDLTVLGTDDMGNSHFNNVPQYSRLERVVNAVRRWFKRRRF